MPPAIGHTFPASPSSPRRDPVFWQRPPTWGVPGSCGGWSSTPREPGTPGVPATHPHSLVQEADRGHDAPLAVAAVAPSLQRAEAAIDSAEPDFRQRVSLAIIAEGHLRV